MLRTVASEEETEVAGTSHDECWPEPLAWDDAASTSIPDLSHRSLDEIQWNCSTCLTKKRGPVNSE